MLFISHKHSFRVLTRCISVIQRQPSHCFSRRCYSVLQSRTYDDAIDLLNTLQTPYSVLKKRWDAGIKLDENDKALMGGWLSRLGYTQNDLTKLNIIHVAGTKGKGSTCAYVDSILGQYGRSHDIPKKIGLFTSPHLIAVRERIRLNSAPISAALFSKYFFEVWDKLEASSDSSDPQDKPFYFRYLTLMSYHAFIQEGVEVAIYEVGIGGEYDSTNLVERPAATGISALGIDHTFLLGDTIDKIAWNKAGIQKKDVPSFTVEQLPEALEVIKNRADERAVKSLNVVGLDRRLNGVNIKPDAAFQRGNASLAIALADTVLAKVDPTFRSSKDKLPKEFIDGLEKVVWRGRCEMKIDGNITWYLDGAHTPESIVVAAKWFSDESVKHPGEKVLIFNQQGQRDAIELLEGLHRAIKQGYSRFDHVIFCPTGPSQTFSKDFVNLTADATAIAGLSMQREFAQKWKTLDGTSDTNIEVMSSLEDAFDFVRKVNTESEGQESSGQVHAFITGSVHLVGRALGVLEGVDAL